MLEGHKIWKKISIFKKNINFKKKILRNIIAKCEIISNIWGLLRISKLYHLKKVCSKEFFLALFTFGRYLAKSDKSRLRWHIRQKVNKYTFPPKTVSTERAKNGQDHHDLFIALTFGHKGPSQLWILWLGMLHTNLLI